MSNPAPCPNFQTIGTANGSPIVANGVDGFGQPVSVMLTADFTPNRDLYSSVGGWPPKPPAGGFPVWHAQVQPSGSTSLFWPCEAAAIVAAGAGVLA
jgi:hypothetical protein